MTKTAIVTTEAPPPAATYSQAVRSGQLLQVAGQGPSDPDTGVFVGDTIAQQTERTLDSLAAILSAAGSNFDDVVMVRVYLTSPDDFDDMNEVYGRYVREPFPARTTVYVGLPEGMLVEIDALAVLPAD
ncbi:MAG: Rid family detoxifying hydrolase [Nocardioidaceae bacterium]